MRLTKPISGVSGIDRQPEFVLERRLADPLARNVALAIGPGQRGIDRGVPQCVVYAIEDSDEIVAAVLQDAVHAAAEFRGEDLAGIGGADGGDPVGVAQPGLQERHLLIELDAAAALKCSGGIPSRSATRRESCLGTPYCGL